MTDLNTLLPHIDGHFTVHSGPLRNNLEHHLREASLKKTDPLHPIKPHIEAITSAFDSPTIKRLVRTGGLSSYQQKLLFKKVVKNDPSIKENKFAKKAIKNVIGFYSKNKTEEHHAIARRYYDYEDDAQTPHGTTSISELMHNSPTAGDHGTINKPQHFGSIAQVVSQPKIRPAALSSPPHRSTPSINLTSFHFPSSFRPSI